MSSPVASTKKKILIAMCYSERCSKNKDRGVQKETTQNFCPDCGCAIFWCPPGYKHFETPAERQRL